MATITSISALTGVAGTPITITGTGFGAGQAASTVTVGGIMQTVSSWSDTSITFLTGADVTQGDVIINLQSQVYCGAFQGPGQP